MPNIPLLSELGAKAAVFQEKLNVTPIPPGLAAKLSPNTPTNELFTAQDSRIFVRARPILDFDNEPTTNATVVQKIPGHKDAVLMCPKISLSGACTVEPQKVQLDGIYVNTDTTEMIYEEACSPLVGLAVSGASTCVLCYGQTGSGKTHTTSTMLRFMVRDLCANLKDFAISVAAVEIQALKNVDLLSANPAESNVQVVETPTSEIELLGCERHEIQSEAEMLRLINRASDARSTRATQRNTVSSRSHLVFRVALQSRATSWAKPGNLFVADLAGSESTADTSQHDKTRQQEAKFINTSLMTLKDCIRARATSGQSAKHVHIPYRQSPLTLMLRDCFELAVKRPTKVVVIACVSPLLRDARHTFNTLRYATLLTTTPTTQMIQPNENDPSTWTREACLEFLVTSSHGRLKEPELVLPEGDGRAMVHIPEAEFIIRAVAAGLPEKSAQMLYTQVWKAVIDARTAQRKNATGIPNERGFLQRRLAAEADSARTNSNPPHKTTSPAQHSRTPPRQHPSHPAQQPRQHPHPTPTVTSTRTGAPTTSSRIQSTATHKAAPVAAPLARPVAKKGGKLELPPMEF